MVLGTGGRRKRGMDPLIYSFSFPKYKSSGYLSYNNVYIGNSTISKNE